jgi:hypothetical protein
LGDIIALKNYRGYVLHDPKKNVINGEPSQSDDGDPMSPDTIPDADPRSLRPLTVTLLDARRISGLGPTTLWKLLKEGRLEAVHIGRRTLITLRSLEKLLDPAASPPRRKPGRPRKLHHGDAAVGDATATGAR